MECTDSNYLPFTIKHYNSFIILVYLYIYYYKINFFNCIYMYISSVLGRFRFSLPHIKIYILIDINRKSIVCLGPGIDDYNIMLISYLKSISRYILRVRRPFDFRSRNEISPTGSRIFSVVLLKSEFPVSKLNSPLLLLCINICQLIY